MFTIPKLTVPRVITRSVYDCTNDRPDHQPRIRPSHHSTVRPNHRTNNDNRLHYRTAEVPTDRTTERPGQHRQQDRTSEPPTDITTEPSIHQPTVRPNDRAKNCLLERTTESLTQHTTEQPRHRPTTRRNNRATNRLHAWPNHLPNLTSKRPSYRSTDLLEF